MPISHEHKAIFVHIPKCAGTSIEYALGMHGNLEHIGVIPYVNQVIDQTTLFGRDRQHYTLDQIRLEVGEDLFDSYFKFAIVRNPWDRFISHVAWTNGKWHKKLNLTNEEVDHALLLLKNSYVEGVNLHLRPQWKYLYCEDMTTKIDYIARYERLAKDWEYIKERLKVEVDLEHRMSSVHSHYRQYLTADKANVIAEFYRKDIELFDYKFRDNAE